MKLFFNLLKKIKDKIGFRIMTKEEYALFLRKKRMVHNSNFSMDDINTNNSSFFNSNFSMNGVNTNNSSFIHNEINPATGLTTSNGIDVGGNPYGVDLSGSFDSINPATGLPTSNGIDVGGNPYGVDLSGSFEHSFQDLGNSYHNDSHHN
ncbi:hypothetical protein J5A60_01900 [Aggregatibacter sp. oral taxon 513]|uniref:hypothetical protein n=1 Tax=Aggregatibacter sp. oral taxon 513 TaxID=712150 RepID=UPI001BA87201|nr:hypothetical protein [Aggregatibacter sp. oral taxon 513]QUC06231.1 hypothetical protein J5A60_01900 [Aggregatibacter sp. oral taxon 513]